MIRLYFILFTILGSSVFSYSIKGNNQELIAERTVLELSMDTTILLEELEQITCEELRRIGRIEDLKRLGVIENTDMEERVFVMGEDTLEFSRIDGITVSIAESQIRCNHEYRSRRRLNMIVYSSKTTNELRGVISGILILDTLVYDRITPLTIKSFDANWLRLADVETNEMIFWQSIEQSMSSADDYELFLYYSNKVSSVITDLVCWIEVYSSLSPPRHRWLFTFPFRVKPSRK